MPTRLDYQPPTPEEYAPISIWAWLFIALYIAAIVWACADLFWHPIKIPVAG